MPPASLPAALAAWRRICTGLLLVGVLLVAGCDDPPTAPNRDAEAPRVRNLQYTPQRVLLSDTDPEANVSVPLQLNVTAEPGTAPIDRVVFSFLASGSNLGATGTLTPLSQENTYGLSAQFTLPATPDQYTVRVFAIGADSLQSNVALGQLRIVSDTPATP